MRSQEVALLLSLTLSLSLQPIIPLLSTNLLTSIFKSALPRSAGTD
ncbi:hypothetical protein ACFXQA_01000 [Microbacterium sp. P07]